MLRRLEAVNADHLGSQDRSGAGADAGNGVDLIGVRQGLMNLGQEIAKVVLLLPAAAELTDEQADQFLGGCTTEAADGGARCRLEFLVFVCCQRGNGW